jgi:hypothetical protein
VSEQTSQTQAQAQKPEKKLFVRVQAKRSGVKYLYITAIADEAGWQKGQRLRLRRAYDDKNSVVGCTIVRAKEQVNPKPVRPRRRRVRDPLSSKRCLRCKRWSPIEANFCIRCGGNAFDKVETARDRPDLQQEAQASGGSVTKRSDET